MARVSPPDAGDESGADEPDARSLASHHAALTLFAEAIAGRSVAIDGVEDPVWPDRPSMSGAVAVAVPSRLASDDEAGRRRHRTLVLHQVVALVEAEGQVVDSAAMRAVHPLAPDVFAVIEDHRIDQVLSRRFPGARDDLQRTLATALAQFDPSSLPPAVAALRVRTLGASPRPDGPLGVERALDAVRSATATIATSVEAAIEFCAALDAHGVWVADDVDAPTEDGFDVQESTAGASPNRDGTIASVVDVRGLVGGHAIDDAELPASSGEADDGEGGGGIDFPPAHRSAEPASIARTFVYDEWDFRERRHRPAWCRLTERRLAGDDPDFIHELRGRHRELRHEIRRSFAHLRPERLIRVHRSDTGDELDLDAVIEARSDRRAGAPVDDRLHIRRDRGERDVATAFLLDLSASTSSAVEPVESSSPPLDDNDDPLAPLWVLPDDDLEPPRRVIDVAVDAVGLMSDALGELGDPHAIYGFSGTGRHEVDFVIAKDFADAASPATWSALAAMRPMRYTRMGPALRHAAMRLGREHAETRLLVMVSDGYPQDVDYGRDARDREHGLYDTARALEEAHRRGIDTFCVTIDPAGHDYLREMCPDQRYLVIDDVETLPAELAKVWLALRAG